MYWIPGTLFVVIFAVFFFNSCNTFGYPVKGTRLDRIKNSENFRDGIFVNSFPTTIMTEGKTLEAFKSIFFSKTGPREPELPVPVRVIAKDRFSSPPESGLRVTWIGHSTLLVEMEGCSILFDPAMGMRASPFRWSGPKRFYEPAASVEDLPDIDMVVISHDHYDHLDEHDIRGLISKAKIFYAPLGVGAHLEGWGVPPEKIREFDWWEETESSGLKLVCAPARHFSGRGIFNRNKTLWASWAVIGSRHRLYFSGDSGYFPTYKEIGDRYGPFDISLMHIGAYNDMWRQIHSNPEEAMQAHIDLRSDVFLPIHWGTFNLAPHSWYDPVERTVAAAQKNKIRLVVPMPGESIDISNIPEVSYWWRKAIKEDK